MISTVVEGALLSTNLDFSVEASCFVFEFLLRRKMFVSACGFPWVWRCLVDISPLSAVCFSCVVCISDMAYYCIFTVLRYRYSLGFVRIRYLYRRSSISSINIVSGNTYALLMVVMPVCIIAYQINAFVVKPPSCCGPADRIAGQHAGWWQ